MNPLRPCQVKALRMITDAVADGQRAICVQMPTGAGKTRVVWERCRDALHVGWKVAVYTNRKMLLEQLQRTAKEFGLHFGTRWSGELGPREMPSDEPMQICSIQTEDARTLRKKVWQIHDADEIIIDEAHLNKGETMQALLAKHREAKPDCVYVGMTATPIDVGHLYKTLIQPTSMSELRESGALVMARHFGCEEPDRRKVKKSTVEMTENDVRKLFQVQHIIGHVFKRFDELNPDRKPTLLFAPGVAESIWFAEQFRKRGIEWAHIDGRTCMYKGERYDSTGKEGEEVRNEIMRAWRAGEVVGVSNRFVMREGIDAPWIEHIILATILAQLGSYLQSLGRGLRAYDGKDDLVIQDHGGHWWHPHLGSVNANREWSLDDSEHVMAGIAENKARNNKIAKPLACPQCRNILIAGRCSNCGFKVERSSRLVVMEDGELREHSGNMFPPRFTKRLANTEDVWKRTYHRAKNSKNGMTFSQARALFFYENRYWPPPDLPFMPKEERDWFRRVRDVPRESLT